MVVIMVVIVVVIVVGLVVGKGLRWPRQWSWSWLPHSAAHSRQVAMQALTISRQLSPLGPGRDRTSAVVRQIAAHTLRVQVDARDHRRRVVAVQAGIGAGRAGLCAPEGRVDGSCQLVEVEGVAGRMGLEDVSGAHGPFTTPHRDDTNRPGCRISCRSRTP